MRGYGTAARSISIPSCCRALASTTPRAPPASPTARRRSPAFPIRTSTPRGCSCARPSALAASRKSLPSGQLQLAGKADISRLTLQVGKFSVVDVFDGNAYAHDPRKDFMNWSIWASGAFDYAADKLGLGYGATAELNQKQWALRGGYFLMDAESNSNNFDMNVGRARRICRGARDALFAVRPARQAAHARLRQQRLLRQLSRDAGQSRAQPRHQQTRRGRLKYGYALNLEQAITDDIGVFAPLELERRPQRDHGVHRHRPQPVRRRLGQGQPNGAGPTTSSASPAPSTACRRTIATSSPPAGSGLLIGDGALNYRHERDLEAYYAYRAEQERDLHRRLPVHRQSRPTTPTAGRCRSSPAACTASSERRKMQVPRATIWFGRANARSEFIYKEA